jgi:aryl-alcohol dehydrogenase-like predicted oxidoreductase
MSYGSKQWQDWVLDEDEALPLIEHAYKRGINTWDTVSERSGAQIKRRSHIH